MKYTSPHLRSFSFWMRFSAIRFNNIKIRLQNPYLWILDFFLWFLKISISFRNNLHIHLPFETSILFQNALNLTHRKNIFRNSLSQFSSFSQFLTFCKPIFKSKYEKTNHTCLANVQSALKRHVQLKNINIKPFSILFVEVTSGFLLVAYLNRGYAGAFCCRSAYASVFENLLPLNVNILARKICTRIVSTIYIYIF